MGIKHTNFTLSFIALLFLNIFALDASAQIAERDSTVSVQKTDKWIAADKAKHFTAGVIATTFLYNFSYHELQKSKVQSRERAIFFSLGISIGKEVKDHFQPGNHFCWKDLIADILGIALGTILVNQ